VQCYTEDADGTPSDGGVTRSSSVKPSEVDNLPSNPLTQKKSESEMVVGRSSSGRGSARPHPASLSSTGKRSATTWSARAASEMGPNESSPSRKQEARM
jgi:hypothetical protein